MKRHRRRFHPFLSLLLFTVLGSLAISLWPKWMTGAVAATSYTMTLDRKHNMVRTQDAYLPERTVMKLQLKDPQDIFVDNEDRLVVADTGNKRIVYYDQASDKIVREIRHKDFQTPKGIFITRGGDLYVADTNAGSVFVFDRDGKLKQQYSHIESASFNRPFRPQKVSVDYGGSLYIISEGVYDGVIQLSSAGEFLGFFTSNRVQLDLVQMIQDLIFTKEQQAQLFDRTPQTFSNLFTDDKGVLYTSTIGGDTSRAIKKHNTAGENMLTPSLPVKDILDVYVDPQGIIYASSASGRIYVYTSEGMFIYYFGTSAIDMDVAGIFSKLTSLAVDKEGKIWALDSDKGLIQSFKPTEYATRIYGALNDYYNGRYEDAIRNWEDVLRLNQMSVLAHDNIARNYYSRQNYEMAMKHAEIAGNRFYYSSAFWEIRNQWLQNNVGYVMGAILIYLVLRAVIRRVNRKTHFLRPVEEVRAKIRQLPLWRDIIFIFPVMRHPVNSFYEMKKRRSGSTLGAIIVYVLFFIILVYSLIGSGFLNRYADVEDFSLQRWILIYFGLSLLFVLCNYLVTSLQDGEGTFGDIFRVFAYSLGPVIPAVFFTTLGSYVMTSNELFILTFIQNIAVIWSAILLLVGLQEIHVYETGETVKSIVVSVAFMAIILLVGSLFIVMGEMLIQFVTALVKEGLRHVQ